MNRSSNRNLSQPCSSCQVLKSPEKIYVEIGSSSLPKVVRLRDRLRVELQNKTRPSWIVLLEHAKKALAQCARRPCEKRKALTSARRTTDKIIILHFTFGGGRPFRGLLLKERCKTSGFFKVSVGVDVFWVDSDHGPRLLRIYS